MFHKKLNYGRDITAHTYVANNVTLGALSTIGMCKLCDMEILVTSNR
jgi:hypothetical protein